jgi:hypothetical protein
MAGSTSEDRTSLIVSSETKFGFNPIVEIISVSFDSDTAHHFVLVPPLSAISFIIQKYKNYLTHPSPLQGGELKNCLSPDAPMPASFLYVFIPTKNRL